VNPTKGMADEKPIRLGTTMADHKALKVVGLLFASITIAVMLTTALVVKGHADGHYSLEASELAE